MEPRSKRLTNLVLSTWVSWFRSELGCGLESHRQQFLSSASNFLSLKKSSPKTPSFGVQFSVPSRSVGYEPIDSAVSRELDNVDAHTLARSEVRFASKKCCVTPASCQLRGHQVRV
jgi:hypothetical protein